MAKKQKPLPKPLSTPFGRKRSFEKNDIGETLIADRMAKAMADGTLEKFLQKELPDNEHARKLAHMMMGMTGMMPPQGISAHAGKDRRDISELSGRKHHEAISPATEPPEDVMNAVKNADVKGLMVLLKREYKKQRGSKEGSVDEKNKNTTSFRDQAVIDKETIEHLIKIASDNNLSFDWLFFRALKRYVDEYQKTGNL
jgi:hypothetical protein